MEKKKTKAGYVWATIVQYLVMLWGHRGGFKKWLYSLGVPHVWVSSADAPPPSLPWPISVTYHEGGIWNTWRLTRAESHTHYPQREGWVFLLCSLQYCVMLNLTMLPVVSSDRCWRRTAISQQLSNQIHWNARTSSVILASSEWQMTKAAAKFKGTVLLKFSLLMLPSVPEALCEVTEGTDLSPPFQTWKEGASKQMSFRRKLWKKKQQKKNKLGCRHHVGF